MDGFWLIFYMIEIMMMMMMIIIIFFCGFILFKLVVTGLFYFLTHDKLFILLLLVLFGLFVMYFGS